MATKTVRFWERYSLLAAIGFYFSFVLARSVPPANAGFHGMPAPLFFLSCFALGVGLYHLPYHQWVILFACLIPFEFSAALWRFPVLSPIDYLCVITMMCLIVRLGFRSLAKQVYHAFGVWGILLWACFYAYGMLDAWMAHGQIRGLLRTGEYLYAFFLARLAFRDETTPRILAQTLAWLGGLSALYAMGQYVASKGNYYLTYGTFHHHNGFSAFLSLCLPAMWGLVFLEPKRNRLFWGVAASLAFAALILSFSRGAWLGLIVGGSLVLFMKLLRRSLVRSAKLAYCGLFLFFATAVAIPFLVVSWNPNFEGIETKNQPHAFSLSQRPIYWQAAHAILESHPWFGLGPGNYESQITSYLTAESMTLYSNDTRWKQRVDFWQHLHSAYLQVVVEYGGVGFLLWSLAMAAFVTPSLVVAATDLAAPWAPYFLISIIGFLVHNTVDVLYVSSLDLLFAFLLAYSRKPAAGL